MYHCIIRVNDNSFKGFFRNIQYILLFRSYAGTSGITMIECSLCSSFLSLSLESGRNNYHFNNYELLFFFFFKLFIHQY